MKNTSEAKCDTRIISIESVIVFASLFIKLPKPLGSQVTFGLWAKLPPAHLSIAHSGGFILSISMLNVKHGSSEQWCNRGEGAKVEGQGNLLLANNFKQFSSFKWLKTRAKCDPKCVKMSVFKKLQILPCGWGQKTLVCDTRSCNS